MTSFHFECPQTLSRQTPMKFWCTCGGKKRVVSILLLSSLAPTFSALMVNLSEKANLGTIICNVESASSSPTTNQSTGLAMGIAATGATQLPTRCFVMRGAMGSALSSFLPLHQHFASSIGKLYLNVPPNKQRARFPIVVIFDFHTNTLA